MLEAVNGQLKKNNFELTNKYQTKEGEATNLRNEVRAIKQHYDQQKLLKIQENEHLKNSWVQEKRDFQKMGNTLKAELEMAKMDAITSRLNSTTAVVRRPVKKIITTKKLDISVGGSKNKLFESSGMAMDSRIFDNLVDEFHDTFSLSLKDRLKYNYLLKLQTTLAKMQVDYSEFGCFKDEMIDDVSSEFVKFVKFNSV